MQHTAWKDGKQSLVNKSSIGIWFARIRTNSVTVFRGHGCKQQEVELEEEDLIILQVEKARWDKLQVYPELDLKVLRPVINLDLANITP